MASTEVSLHNWDPRWASTLYGSWAAVRYSRTAKGYICGAVVTNLALSSGLPGCNPNFNHATIGTYTSWTPVKGLTFLAELNYMMLDQKYASGSTVTLPLQANIAKPGAAYELKNQNSLHDAASRSTQLVIAKEVGSTLDVQTGLRHACWRPFC
ncbi:porin [Bradyrhizobium sp. STM 3561]|uniref:porin n=1 Tax=Bradyrhizobium sp. STM 3561 TaxID=578923 RepID=UPI003890027A